MKAEKYSYYLLHAGGKRRSSTLNVPHARNEREMLAQADTLEVGEGIGPVHHFHEWW